MKNFYDDGTGRRSYENGFSLEAYFKCLMRKRRWNCKDGQSIKYETQIKRVSHRHPFPMFSLQMIQFKISKLPYDEVNWFWDFAKYIETHWNCTTTNHSNVWLAEGKVAQSYKLPSLVPLISFEILSRINSTILIWRRWESFASKCQKGNTINLQGKLHC